MKTGFNAAEIFRKYLWYLLRERKFDTEAASDVVQLKASLQLSDEEVGRLLVIFHPCIHLGPSVSTLTLWIKSVCCLDSRRASWASCDS